jgi:hypothetical protein
LYGLFIQNFDSSVLDHIAHSPCGFIKPEGDMKKEIIQAQEAA